MLPKIKVVSFVYVVHSVVSAKLVCKGQATRLITLSRRWHVQEVWVKRCLRRARVKRRLLVRSRGIQLHRYYTFYGRLQIHFVASIVTLSLNVFFNNCFVVSIGLRGKYSSSFCVAVLARYPGHRVESNEPGVAGRNHIFNKVWSGRLTVKLQEPNALIS